ncbi:UDP-3-O-(3-hydroxymyristoyl)glucosamine N-acyltransferase [Myxococcota bacterium]
MPNGITLAVPDTVAGLATRLGGVVDGPIALRQVERVCPPHDADGGPELIVLSTSRHLGQVLGFTSPVLCSEHLASQVPLGRRWVHSHVMWAVAQLTSVSPESQPLPHPSSYIHSEAELADEVEVRAGAVILRGVKIGRGSTVGENAVLYPGVELGAHVMIGPLAVVGRPGFGWTHGPDGGLVRMPHRGGVIVGDEAEIGPLCTVDAGTLGPTRIGAGAKLDAHVHVGHNVTIGAGTMVAAQAGFAGSATVGEGVLIGGQAGIADHARIGSGARIAAQSGVIGDVPEGETVAGFPAVPRDRFFRAMARMLRLSAQGR